MNCRRCTYLGAYNKTIATGTIRFMATVAIVVCESLIPVVSRMLTFQGILKQMF